MVKSNNIISNKKIDYMRTYYDDNDFIDFIKDIKSQKLIPSLQEELKYYVLFGLRNKDNTIKYGLSTQKEFINAFKKRTNKVILVDSSKKIQIQEQAIKTLAELFILWCKDKNIIDLNPNKTEIEELSDIGIFKKFKKQNKQKHISKEVVSRFYRFNPYIDIDESLSELIDEFQYSENSTEEDIGESNDYDDNEEDNELTEEEVVADYEDLTEEEVLKNKIADLKLKIKQLEISEPQKMKKSLEEKINHLEYKNQSLRLQLEEITNSKTNDNQKNYTNDIYYEKYINLKKTYDKIKDLKIADLDKKIKSDKKYQQLIMSLILHNSVATKLLIKHLDISDTVRNSILEARAEVSDLEQQMQEMRSGYYIKNLPNDEINYTGQWTYDAGEYEFKLDQYLKIVKNNLYDKYDDYAKNIDMRKISDASFMIVEDEKLITSLELENNSIPYCRVSVEPTWHGISDWFGYYDANGKFVPSKTGISDYYRFVKETKDLPFGVIIFDNFNQIPPEIYIEPFIKAMETTEVYSIVNPSLIKDNGYFAQINKLSSLKFIFVKSMNSTNFPIPESLRKYELGV